MSALTKDNPLNQNPGRAPYELAHLLRRLPVDFAYLRSPTQEQKEAAGAALEHIEDATGTLLHGLEAIGALLFSAGTNKDFPVAANQLPDLGSLIQHLAVELQMLHDLEDSVSAGLK
ncbi:MAG: hypothetical protein JWP36_1137 [Paucimonas sp.]|nr:hypothetical protein [Paucimonas sp.]